ncbi:MAG: pilus assembly protein PilM [Aquificaceae bacterium]|nr:pilus assembly protein PilM [Aquificaceae bacterium]
MKLALEFPRFIKGVQTVVGMYFTDKVIRLLELGKDRRPVSEPIEVNIEGRDRNMVLKEIVQKYGLTGKRVSTCIPANDGLLKFYKYPTTMSKKDLLSAVEWSIKRELSAMREETYYDYFILEPRPEDKQVGVVLVLSRKETVDGINKMLESAGLKLYVLDYEVVAIINYGLYHRLPIPFSILYIDYNHSILTTYSPANISYYLTYWGFREFMKNQDEESLRSFFAEIRNIVVLNDLSSIYVAGPILAEEEMLTRIMENLPILGLLDLEGINPIFFIPYTLSIRGMEE